MIKNLGQKNDGTTFFLSSFDNLEAVPPTVNCSMTSLNKVDKNHGQKNEMIKIGKLFVFFSFMYSCCEQL